MSEPEVRCPRCGEPVAAAVPGQPARCDCCGEEFTPPTAEPPAAEPKPLGIELWFEGERPPWVPTPPPQEAPPPLPEQPPPLPPVEVPPPAAQAEPPAPEPAAPPVEELVPVSPPPPVEAGELVMLDESPVEADLPTAKLHSGSAPAEPLPEAAFGEEDVPVVRPSGRSPSPVPPPPPPVPTARPSVRRSDPTPGPRPTPLVPPRVEPPRPVRPPADEEEPHRPRAQIGLALLVLFLMVTCMIGALSVIIYAIWAGFSSVSRPGRSDAPAEVRWVVAAEPAVAGERVGV